MMQTGGPLDSLPLWCLSLITLAAILLSIEGGLRLGWYRRRHSTTEDKPPVGEMVAATLALLAFILAFTFGLAGSWFDARRRLVVDEANAIGTAYLRAGLLPESDRSVIRDLLREYLEVRLEAIEPGKLARSIARSEELQARLWERAAAVGEAHPNSIVVGLFVGSLNEVIDIHAQRLAIGARTRLPGTIWAALYFVALLGMMMIGYHAGLSGSGRSPAILPLVLAFSAILTLIADLDRPQQGSLRVSPRPLLDLRRNLGAPSRPPSLHPSAAPPGPPAVDRGGPTHPHRRPSSPPPAVSAHQNRVPPRGRGLEDRNRPPRNDARAGILADAAALNQRSQSS